MTIIIIVSIIITIIINISVIRAPPPAQLGGKPASVRCMNGDVQFNFGLVWFTLHLAKVLFILARDLFNFGLVCLAFSPGLVYFGQGLV